MDLTLDFFANGMRTLCRPGDRALILFPARVPDSVGALLKHALEPIGVTVFLTGPEEGGELVRQMGIDVVCGPPQWLARTASDSRGASLRAVLSSSDALLPIDRKTIMDHWSCTLFDHYGMTETGLGGAVDCDAHLGCTSGRTIYTM